MQIITAPARQKTVIGCAGWSIPKLYASNFPDTGTHLERYAARFCGVEINSSFYRPHRPQTYKKWAASVPEHFRFAVKVPKVITHELRLQNASEPLQKFVAEVTALGPRLGPLLVQLPPSLSYDGNGATAFFSALRELFAGEVACEPRHASWFTPEADALLAVYQVARVAADPAVVPEASEPGGWKGLVYYRLHGSPTIYRSAYSIAYLRQLSARLQHLSTDSDQPSPAWCIFDNTAEGEATGNALELIERLSVAGRD
jgi:uncharacterized protein YecE (DUF72 family)